jgi:hypothetical protein
MIIDLPMGYAFIVPENREPYIINSHGEIMSSIMLTGTAVAVAVYLAMKRQIDQLEDNLAVVKGELELLENLAKLSGTT